MACPKPIVVLTCSLSNFLFFPSWSLLLALAEVLYVVWWGSRHCFNSSILSYILWYIPACILTGVFCLLFITTILSLVFFLTKCWRPCFLFSFSVYQFHFQFRSTPTTWHKVFVSLSYRGLRKKLAEKEYFRSDETMCQANPSVCFFFARLKK